MKLYQTFPLLCVSLLSAAVWGAGVKGRIVDNNGEPLPGATIRIIAMPDTVRAAYSMSGDNGDFNIEGLRPGQYVAVASMVSMEDGISKFTVGDSTDTVDLGTIRLGDDAIMLDEAVVTAIKAAVVAKQDTLEFNAGSFHTAPNATVNDLLKKLPGVEVGSDGSVTANGKTITKILVDGKEFFGDDPQMATKNLPSNMVDKVQVIDRKSDLARLTGVDDGEEETVINLSVKKDMNNGWFGNVGAGYGTDGRYQGSFTVNNFSNGNQITILGGLNNINENGFTDRGRGRFRDFGGDNGITAARRLGLNFNVGKDDVFRVGGNVLYSHSDRKSESRTATQYLYPDAVNIQDATSSQRDQGHNINSDFRLQWNIDSNNTLEFRPGFRLNFRDSESDSHSRLRQGDADATEINSNDNLRNNNGTSIEASGELIFNHNFASRPGRSFSLQAGYSFSNTRQHSTSLSNIIYYLSHDDDEQLYRYLDNHTWGNTLQGRLTWTEPLGNVARGNFLTFAYNMKYQWSNADKLTYNLPALGELPEGFVLPDFSEVPAGAEFSTSLSNSFRNKFFSQELQAGYKKVNKSLNLEAGLLFAPSSSKSEDLIDPDRNIPTRWVWNVSPYANVRWKIAERSSIRARYRARTALPSMTQLQPVADVSDPLNIIQGNPDLNPTFTQTVGIFFNNYTPASQQAITAMVNASYSLNSVAARTVTDPLTGGRTTTYTNVDGNLNLSAMGMLMQPISGTKFRVSGRLMARFASTPGYINGDYNRIGNLNLSPAFGVTFSSDIFQMTVYPTYAFGNITNTLEGQASRTTHAYGFNSDASLYLPFGLELSTDLNFSKQNGMSQGFNSAQWLWNAQLSYSFLSDKSLTAAVRAYDILGQKKNISRSVGANTIVDSEFNDLTRYVMFSLTWNFNTLAKKGASASTPGIPEGDMQGPPPGEGDGGRGPRGEGGQRTRGEGGQHTRGERMGGPGGRPDRF
ncbi:MAG: outer membrane beta-barrel protein [Muribaculaceae bacterium]|nr:outer membrane beta-barrel protein [Muribaculaceae bacterium]